MTWAGIGAALLYVVGVFYILYSFFLVAKFILYDIPMDIWKAIKRKRRKKWLVCPNCKISMAELPHLGPEKKGFFTCQCQVCAMLTEWRIRGKKYELTYPGRLMGFYCLYGPEPHTTIARFDLWSKMYGPGVTEIIKEEGKKISLHLKQLSKP